jgi:deferrochelatase/peroxidase EfeB
VLDRRSLLTAILTGALASPVIVGCSDDGTGGTGGLNGTSGQDAVARHPALAPPQDAVTVLGLDVTTTGPPGRAAALALLRRIDDRGHPGTMVGFGASLFDRAGVPTARPAALTAMPPFVGDVLDPARTGGDLLLHVEADDVDQARDRAKQLTQGLTGLTVRWQLAGGRDDNRVQNGRPLVRNPFGYTEGHGNAPAASALAAAEVLIPRTPGEPGWTAGASLLAVRVVRLARELWNTDDQAQQDRIMGRHRDGSWLDGRPATAEPAFADDPDGAVTPLDSHVRAVNPRTPGKAAPRLMRRGWAYSAGLTAQGQPDEGILFMAYQADFEAGFARAQRRLQTEALTPYVLATGGGYFAVPARRPAGGWAAVL